MTCTNCNHHGIDHFEGHGCCQLEGCGCRAFTTAAIPVPPAPTGKTQGGYALPRSIRRKKFFLSRPVEKGRYRRKR